MAKTIKSLTSDLHDVFTQVKSGKMEHKKARILSGVAGKIIDASKVRLKYKALLFNESVNKITELE